MKALNPNERRLVMILSGALFVVLNIFAVRAYLAQTQKVQARIGDLESSAKGYEVILQDQPRWEARQAWMQAFPMSPYEGSATDSRFTEEIQRSLVQGGLAIEAQQLHEAATEGDVVVVALDLNIKGSLEQIVRWMQTIQQPGKYLAIRSFTLKRFDEGSVMSLRLTACQLYRAGQLASAP